MGGLPLPVGVERHNLYTSSFRIVTTYAMALADLDNELKAILEKKACTIKFDDRRNFVGKCERAPQPLLQVSCVVPRCWHMGPLRRGSRCGDVRCNDTLVHVMM